MPRIDACQRIQKAHVILYSNYEELEYQIKNLKENKSHWEKIF